MTEVLPVRPYLRRDGEGTALWFLGSLVTTKATGAETGGRLTVVEFVNPPGLAPPLHRRLDEDELVYVLSGGVQFRCDGGGPTDGPRDCALVPVGLAHAILGGAAEP